MTTICYFGARFNPSQLQPLNPSKLGHSGVYLVSSLRADIISYQQAHSGLPNSAGFVSPQFLRPLWSRSRAACVSLNYTQASLYLSENMALLATWDLYLF
jgi:hypothetical protein